MTSTASRTMFALSLPLIVLLPVTAAGAQRTPPGAAATMGHEVALTCQMMAEERATIDAAVAKTAERKLKSAKLKKGLFGIAKGFATAMVPGAAMLGGSSALGSLAMQGASQSAAQALSGGNGVTPRPLPQAQPTPEQAARLTELERLSAARRCPA